MARSAEPCELIASTAINCPVQQCWDCYIDNQLTAQWSPAVVKIDCEQPFIELLQRELLLQPSPYRSQSFPS